MQMAPLSSVTMNRGCLVTMRKKMCYCIRQVSYYVRPKAFLANQRVSINVLFQGAE